MENTQFSSDFSSILSLTLDEVICTASHHSISHVKETILSRVFLNHFTDIERNLCSSSHHSTSHGKETIASTVLLNHITHIATKSLRIITSLNIPWKRDKILTTVLFNHFTHIEPILCTASHHSASH